MLTTRSTKILCSQRCHNQFHYWRMKNYPSDNAKISLRIIDNWLTENTHPNPKHPINKFDEIEAELFRHTITLTTLSKQTILNQSPLMANKHEEAL